MDCEGFSPGTQSGPSGNWSLHFSPAAHRMSRQVPVTRINHHQTVAVISQIWDMSSLDTFLACFQHRHANKA